MANILMASSNIKTLPPSLSSHLTNYPLKRQQYTHHLAMIRCQNLPKLVAGLCKPAASAAAVLLAAAPSMASEIEKAALFDFNLTLPAIALEFLLLMVAPDKIYFMPLWKFMDESLSNVKDTSSEVKQLEEQAAAVMKAARAEISSVLNQMKKETTAELETKLAEGRRKVKAELQEALQSLEKQKEDTTKALDSQIATLSDEIVKKVQLTT